MDEFEQRGLEDRYRRVLDRIASAERRYARAPASVALLAVSKARSAAEIAALALLGQRRFGENYLQEALAKQATLADLGLEWHFIGPVQSNKTRAVSAHFDWVHSIDRERIAARLDEQRPGERGPLNVCIQVNVGGESTKSGVAPADAAALAGAIATMPRLRLRGLMALPPPSPDPNAQRSAFRELRELEERLRDRVPTLDTLSIGTTQDLEAAIAEGATIVRIGTAIFGARRK
jgi:pyridoxal phosphate enzyme (YggS family)